MENQNNCKNVVDDVEPSSHHSLSDENNYCEIDGPSVNNEENKFTFHNLQSNLNDEQKAAIAQNSSQFQNFSHDDNLSGQPISNKSNIEIHSQAAIVMNQNDKAYSPSKFQDFGGQNENSQNQGSSSQFLSQQIQNNQQKHLQASSQRQMDLGLTQQIPKYVNKQAFLQNEFQDGENEDSQPNQFVQSNFNAQNDIHRQSIAPGFGNQSQESVSEGTQIIRITQNQPQASRHSSAQKQFSKSFQFTSSKNENDNSQLLNISDIDLRMSENVNAKTNHKLNTETLFKETKSPTLLENQCSSHFQDYILFCLKCQEKICTKCLDTNHLLHPVVPLNSLNKLDFKISLQKEIEKSLEDIRLREGIVQNKIGKDLTNHKIALRNHIIFIRDQLRKDYDDFFNNMLGCIRSDWNLFEMQQQLTKETRKFSQEILDKLQNITQKDEFDQIYYHNDLKKFYENLSVAQSKVQDFKQDWNEYEKGVDLMVNGLKGYSEFDIIDGNTLKNFLAENLVMNYSNVDLHKLLYQQIMISKQQNNLSQIRGANGQSVAQGSSLEGAQGYQNNNSFARNDSNNAARSIENQPDLNNDDRDNDAGRSRSSNNRPRGSVLYPANKHQRDNRENAQNISFNRNSQLAMANNFAQTGIKMLNKSQNRQNVQEIEAVQTNKIHFFKFDQKIVTFYNVDQERKQREVLNIDFNIPIRFCSIQTNDGRIFITGGAKNTSQSSNHAYEFRNGTLIQLNNMINPREGHCLAAVGNEFIYAIGSRLYNTSKTCEVYSIEGAMWREKPELNRNRYLSTAVTIQQRYIYVFGGYEPSVTDIERLDTEGPEQQAFWELIKVWSSSLESDIKYWFGACAISQNEILIFGGKKDGNSTSSSYIFDTQQNQIQKTGSLPNKDTFYQRTFLCKNNQVYAYGYENDNAYIYNTAQKTWQKK